MAKSPAQEAKERAQKAKNDMDYAAYMRDNEDVRTYYQDSRKEGILKGEGAYSKKYGRNTDGWEEGWLKGMNKKYGAENTDVGQFSRDQFAQYHYDTYGKKEGRKLNEMTDYQQSFVEPHEKYKANKQAYNQAGMAAMGDAYKKDINKYDVKSHGHGKFDIQDVKALRKAGYDDDAIVKYSTSLGADKLSESLRHNHQKFAGQYATKAHDKSKGIESFDVGKGFNIADVNYLRNQGYSDKEIADYANKSVKEGGKSHGNAMANFMQNQGRLDYYHGDWNKAKAKAQAAAKNTDNSINNSFNTDNSTNNSFNTNDSFNTTDSFNNNNSFNTNNNNSFNTDASTNDSFNTTNSNNTTNTNSFNTDASNKVSDSYNTTDNSRKNSGDNNSGIQGDMNTQQNNNQGLIGNNSTMNKDSFNNNEGIIGDNNQQFENSGNVSGTRNMGGNNNVNTDNSFNAETINSNIGKQGDMNTTIGSNNTFGAGSSIGNDYSVTIGKMRFGNNGQFSGTTDEALANMQSATAYNALNNNFMNRSRSQFSGYGRAQGAIDEARKSTSKANSDQAAAFNFAGANQNYLRDRMEEIRNRYMGSMDGYQAPAFQFPTAPRPVDLDPAKDIYKDAMKNLK